MEIKAIVDELAAKIEALEHHSLPSYGRTKDGAHPHIEVDLCGYHYVVIERGQEISRDTTQDLDDLLYLIFQHVTLILACDYELMHRIETQDFRRLLFQQQEELLSQLSPKWSERLAKTHNFILSKHPFDDWSSARVSLSKQVGWAKACAQFPLPEQDDID